MGEAGRWVRKVWRQRRSLGQPVGSHAPARAPTQPRPASPVPAARSHAPPPMPVIHPPPRSHSATEAVVLAASESPAAGPVAKGSKGSPALPAVVVPPPTAAKGSPKGSAAAWARRRPAKPANGSLKLSKPCLVGGWASRGCGWDRGQAGVAACASSWHSTRMPCVRAQSIHPCKPPPAAHLQAKAGQRVRGVEPARSQLHSGIVVCSKGGAAPGRRRRAVGGRQEAHPLRAEEGHRGVDGLAGAGASSGRRRQGRQEVRRLGEAGWVSSHAASCALNSAQRRRPCIPQALAAPKLLRAAGAQAAPTSV